MNLRTVFFCVKLHYLHEQVRIYSLQRSVTSYGSVLWHCDAPGGLPSMGAWRGCLKLWLEVTALSRSCEDGSTNRRSFLVLSIYIPMLCRLHTFFIMSNQLAQVTSLAANRSAVGTWGRTIQGCNDVMRKVRKQCKIHKHCSKKQDQASFGNLL